MEYVLITGSNGGMGSETVKLLIQQGYGVIALDKTLCPACDNCFAIQADITDEQSILSALDAVKQITPKLHAIIHYAGIYALNSLIEMEKNEFERVIKVNFLGACAINRVFVPLLEKNGRIIIMTSELAPLNPLPFTGLYAVSKSALDKYAYSLRMELQLLGISVSVLRAGAVKTDMLGVSTTALEKFVNSTKLYNCNAKRFKKVVDSVEAKAVEPSVIAKKSLKILKKKKPKFAYAVNRNPLLRLLNVLPKQLQFWIIRKILK